MIHTYIHHWPLQPFSQSTLMLCALILYVSDETYDLTSTLNDRFFEKLFMAVLIHSQSFLPEIC